MASTTADIVCVSHLWWDWVWQRPQHLLSRLARHHRVLWVEEPHIEIGPEYEGFEIRDVQPNVQATRLVFRSDANTFWDRLNATLDRSGAHSFKVSPDIREASLMFESPEQPRLEHEVMQYLPSWRRGPLVLWLYTPVVVHFIDLLQPDLVVYDVMDELTSFKFAPARLLQQEQQLVSRADLMFTGGPSLHEARLGRHADLHLFPSGVEQQHFAQALNTELAVPEPLRQLEQPVIGYYGVIDERLDLALLERIAQLRPTWNWVMIGPILKIEKHELPQLPNIHYLGKQEYRDLPAFLKGFSVAMMPFARNEATRFISPTKTLEYMAGHKPIVSTPIKDVIDLYGSVVRIAETAEDFVEQVQAALNEQPDERARRVDRENEFLSRYEWDSIADEMERLIVDRIERKID